MDTLLHDLRFALRALRRSPGFTAVAVLTLALGIGANTAIFSVVDAVLLRPLPFAESDRLVRLFTVSRLSDHDVYSPANFRDARTLNHTLAEVSFFDGGSFTLTGRGEPTQLQGVRVGQNFFQVLRARPALGRVFRAEENQPGQNRVVVLSHSLWQQRFGGDPAIVGRTISLNRLPYEVVGVMPAGFSYPEGQEAWVPEEYDGRFMSEDSRGGYYMDVFGRLKPGVTVEQAARDVHAIGERLKVEHPETNAGFGMTVTSMREATVGDVRGALLILLGAVGLVLLIACANVANLMLARATARDTEMAVRAALGANRHRLVRQLLTESVLLAALGGAAGLLLAVWGTRLLVSFHPEGVPRLMEVRVDGVVMVFTAGVAVLTGLLFGLLPATQMTRTPLASTLREGGRSGLGTRGSARARSILVVAEIALAVMLLTGAGLLIRSFVGLQSVDPGFRPEQVLTWRLNLPQVSYESDASRLAFYDRLLDRLRGQPGVESAAAVTSTPMSGATMVLGVVVEGQPPAEPGEMPTADVLVATPEYLSTMGIPVVRGRAFTAADRAGAPPVVMLNEAAARRLFPGEDPIGRRLSLTWTRDSVDVGGEVVGITPDVRQHSLDGEARPTIYVSYAQAPMSRMDMVVRSRLPLGSLTAGIKREVRALDANLPIDELQPLEQVVEQSISQPRFYMTLLSIFAAVALALAAIGIFGVVSYTVRQRRREIGIRMALGAEPARVLRMVIGGAVGLAAVGVGLGVAGALAGTRLMAGLLFGVGATDPTTFIGVSALLLGIAALSSYLPARSAVRVDPNVALRAD
jgi:predicted permease